MRRRLVLPLALAALLVAAVPAHATFPGVNGKVAIDEGWSYYPEPDFAAYEPTGERTLISTGWAQRALGVAWSPDGARVVFGGQTQADADAWNELRALFVMNADGTGLRQVGRGDRVRWGPVWSPDGSRFAFVQRDGSDDNVYTVSASGANLRRLTPSTSRDSRPDWSPDGTTILYECTVDRRTQLCRRGASGGARTVLTATLGFSEASGHAWSPSGRNIVFVGTRTDGQRGVFRMSRTGTDLRLLVATESSDDTAVWSPDGTRVAYSRWCGGDGEGPCFLVETASASDGSSRRILAGGSEDGYSVSPQGWRPAR